MAALTAMRVPDIWAATARFDLQRRQARIDHGTVGRGISVVLASSAALLALSALVFAPWSRAALASNQREDGGMTLDERGMTDAHGVLVLDG